MSMSCDYYMYTKDATMAFDLLPRVEMNMERREFEIHLCQTALYFKPCFECHSYSSFEELKNILLNRESKFVIEDEYGRTVPPDRFIERMEALNERGMSRVHTKINSEYIVDKDGFEFVDYEFS